MSARIKGNVLTIDGVRTQLANQEVTILWAIMARKNVTEDSIMEMLWPHPDNMPDTWANSIKVIICTLRTKLRPSGWGIKKKYLKPFELVRLG